MGWRVARSLEVLRDEINAIAPGRSKRSDGTIGDAAHASGWSDHNPNASGVVCAFDATHDHAHGADMNKIAATIVATRPPALKYVIWSRRIWQDGRWSPYYGSDPHTGHMHVSVGRGPDGRSTGPYDDRSPWGVEEDHMPTAKEIAEAVWKFDPGARGRGGLVNITGRNPANITVQYAYGVQDIWRAALALEAALAEARRETAASLAALIAASSGGDVQAMVRGELDRAAERERAERAAEQERLAQVLGEGLAVELREQLGDGLDDDALTAAVAAALRRVLGGLDEG